MVETSINLNPDTAEQLLDELTNTQRDRFSQRFDALTAEGASPGDAFQVAATHQRQTDLAEYEPTSEEQEAIARASQQAESIQREGSLLSAGPEIETTSANDTDSTTDSSSSGGLQISSDDLFNKSPDHQAAEAEMKSPQPEALPFQGGGSSNHEAEAGADPEAESPDDDQVAMAEDILENARRTFDNAIAQGAVADERGQLRAENDDYIATLQAENDRLVVENRKTGGIAIGDQDNVSEANGLTDSDQQTWRAYRQQSDENTQQQSQQQQRQRRRQRQQELEL